MGSFFVYQHYSVTTILQVVTPISFLKNVIFSSSLQYRFSKIIPSFFTIKEGSTSHPCPLSSGAREETALLGTVYAPPVPPLREGPYPIPKP